MSKQSAHKLVICLENHGYEVSLERRKVYVALEDAAADALGLLRIIDESGEDFLYPTAQFIDARLPAAVRDAILRSAA